MTIRNEALVYTRIQRNGLRRCGTRKKGWSGKN